MYAVIRVRGNMNLNDRIRDTLAMLNLHRVNHCVIVPDTPTYKGMLKRVEGYITWGDVDKDLVTLLKKHGDEKVYRLSPPRKGLTSIKKHFPKGATGYRGEAINALLRRMI